jgi:hypothetical protein
MLREESGAYDPEELLLLGEVFDRALASLPTALQTPVNRRQIARQISPVQPQVSVIRANLKGLQ